MGFLDFITRSQNKMIERSNNIASKFGITQEQINNIDSQQLFNFQTKKDKTKNKTKTNNEQKNYIQKILDTFYANYNEKPYISEDRPKDWIQRASTFPSSLLVTEVNMTRFSDGLLPGNVYMLYWLKKYTNKKVPSYFEYKYGINFDKEKIFLYSNGYIDNDDKPTQKGEAALQAHYSVIENHSQKIDTSIEAKSAQTLKQKESMLKNGFKEYVIIANSNCCETCSYFDNKHFPLKSLKIGKNAPPFHTDCCCSIAAYSDREEYNEWLNSFSSSGKKDKKR